MVTSGALQQNSGMAEVTPALKLKGRLRPSLQPLNGYSFYFDTNGKDVETLERKITLLGGSVENFLSHEVSYFIRTNESNKQPVRRSNRLLGDYVETRASKMLRKVYSSTNEQVITSTLDRAKKLGLSIHTADKVSKWIKEIEAQQQKIIPQKKEKEKANGRKLQAPFFKVEDKKRRYQPLYKELTSFSRVQFGSNLSDPPIKQNRTQYENTHQQNTRSQTRNLRTALASSNSKNGFCELCEISFTHRGRHIKSYKHRGNVTSEHFNKLDDLIRNGESFSDFMENINGNNKPKHTLNNSPQSNGKGHRDKRQNGNITTRNLRSKSQNSTCAETCVSTYKKRKQRNLSNNTLSSSAMHMPRKRKKGNDHAGIKVVGSASSTEEKRQTCKNISQRKNDKRINEIVKVTRCRYGKKHVVTLRKSKRNRRDVSRFSLSFTREH